jgi:hypothetical protein
MIQILKALVTHLYEKRSSIVREVTVKSEDWNPTYGSSDTNITIEIVDFNQLLLEIDIFTETFERSE